MRKALIFAWFMTLVAGCAGVSDLYRDAYDTREHRYKNESIGFSLDFDGFWNVYAHADSMPPAVREIAKSFKEDGGELIFYATTSNQLLYARAIVEDAGLPLQQYYEIVSEINSDELKEVSASRVKLGKTEMIEWVYEVQVDETKLIFLEYQTRSGPYNIRLGFWTLASLFDEFKKDFQRIARTYQPLEDRSVKTARAAKDSTTAH